MSEDLRQEIDEVIYGSEDNTINWFNNFLKNSSGSFATSAEIFKKYYSKCVKDLVNLKFDKDTVRKSYKDLDSSKEKSLDYKCNYINQQDIDNCISNSYHINIIEILKNNENLRNECIKNGLLDEKLINNICGLSYERIRKLTTEDIYLMLNNDMYFNLNENEIDNLKKSIKLDKDKINETVLPFLKVHRLNNLQIKYAHTARVVYLTNLEYDKLNIDNELMRNITLTSALFHDVGRFYQGAFYNSYNDSDMKNIEGNNKGHAEAGYYYALLDMLSLNTLGVNTSEDLVIHAIAALVVDRHQVPNNKNGDFDEVQYDINFSDDFNSKLFNFVIDAYLEAETFDGGVHARFGSTIPHQQKYIKDAIDNILKSINNMIQQYTSDEEEIEKFMSSAEEFLKRDYIDFLTDEEITKEGFYNDKEVEILKKIFSEEELSNYIIDGKIAVNEKLTNEIFNYQAYKKSCSLFFLTADEVEMLSQIEIPDDIKNKIIIKPVPERMRDGGNKNLIVRTPELNNLLNKYKDEKFFRENFSDNKDFSQFFAKAKKHLSQFVQFDITKSICDIFAGKNERIKKENIDPEIISAIDFALNMVMDIDKMDILVQRVNKRWDNWNTKYINVRVNDGESFVDIVENVFGITLERDSTGKIIIDERLKSILLYNMDSNVGLREKISEIIDINSESFDEESLNKLRELLTGDYNNVSSKKTIKVSYDDMKKCFPNDSERIRKEQLLILPDDLREKVFMLDKDRSIVNGSKFPNNTNASSDEHFCFANVFPAIWWHLDQFIMTNMRSLKSFDFILDTNMLDRLKETYSSPECSEDFKYFIDDIIEYSKEFMKTARTLCVDKEGNYKFSETLGEGESRIQMTDDEIMIKIRDEACRRWQAKKKSNELDSMLDEYCVVTSNSTVNNNHI